MKNYIIFTVTVLVFIILFGPLDIFKHGYFSNDIDITQINSVDILDKIDVTDEKCVLTFSPQNSNLVGLEIFLVDHNQCNSGIMHVLIEDSKGKMIDEIDVLLAKVKDSTWYKIYLTSKFEKNEEYTVRFKISNSEVVPSFLLVNEDYNSKETIRGNILVNYAYTHSTFSQQEKVLIVMIIIVIWCGSITQIIKNEIYRKNSIKVVYFLALSLILSWNYMYNSFDNSNSEFYNFQEDSETLVSSGLYAEWDGIDLINNRNGGYGLGRYCSLKGTLVSYNIDYITDTYWLKGYSKTSPAIVVNSNIVTRAISQIGYYIQFNNGEKFQITQVKDDGTNIVIELDANRDISYARNGNLDEISFFNTENEKIDKSNIFPYTSQYGLQGKVFKYISKYMDKENTIENLHLVCSIMASMVFVIIVMLLEKKYNKLIAGCFYITFLLSPWIVNFARNLYWVEFTWFIPMVVGLVCSIKVNIKKWRIICYLLSYISIIIKCLCGYEYITSIMMGLVSFLCIDLLIHIFNRDNDNIKLLFKTVFVMGVMALFGFGTAICIHANLKGDGSVIQGIKNIIENDVLRRTIGANLNDFPSVYWPSMNASIWEVYSKYFHLPTDVITGITGNMFLLLCVVPIVIFIYEYTCKKQIDTTCISMYVVMFLTSISWFCLAKSHSYVHIHINYVMWYLGFIQICIYIICDRILRMINNGYKQGKNSEVRY